MNYWYATKDGDIAALGLYKRHYSYRRYRDSRELHRRLFIGPGEKMVLCTPDYSALFIWRKFISSNFQDGINNAVFRNESQILSSVLIREACELAWQRWGGERLYTYVNPRKIRSINPGCCFIKAGFRKCGITKSGLIILERLP